MTDNDRSHDSHLVNNPFQLNPDLLRTPDQQPAPDAPQPTLHESPPHVPLVEEQQLEQKKLEIQRQIEALQQSLLQQTVPQPSVPQVSQPVPPPGDVPQNVAEEKPPKQFHKEQVPFEKKSINSDSVQPQTGSTTLWMQLFAVLFVAIPVMVYAYWFTIVDLVHTWSKVIDYHHGYFVVPFVIYFLWARRDTFPTNSKTFDYLSGILLGTFILVLCCFLRYQIMLFSMVTLDAWTILLWVFGVTLIFFGLRAFLWAAPSLFFLAFMFPWPMTLEMALRRPLQEFAAKLSVVLLRIIGEPAVSSKNTIFLGDLQLDVAAACSGIRVLVSVVAAAYAAALLMRRPWWQNILLFFLVIPVALIINAMRIAMTGLLIVHASGFIDRFGFKKPTPVVCDEISGIIMLILAFVSFVAIIFWLGKVFRRVTPVS